MNHIFYKTILIFILGSICSHVFAATQEDILLWEKQITESILMRNEDGSVKMRVFKDKHGKVISKEPLYFVYPETQSSYLNRLPFAQKWSQKIFDVIKTEAPELIGAKIPSDIGYFCPKYKNLNANQRLLVWGQLFSAVAYPESSWNPTTSSQEPCSIDNDEVPEIIRMTKLVSELNPALQSKYKLCFDSVTGRRVQSQGFLQLSYQDQANYADFFDCRFDYKKDQPVYAEVSIMSSKYKELKNTDKAAAAELYKQIYNRRKDISALSPYTNLRCGILIMNRLVQSRGKIKLESPYWSTLSAKKENNPYSKVSWIAKQTKKLSFCK